MPHGGPPAPVRPGFLPGQQPIDAYGRGGFRFADMSHRGSILALPSGMHAWDASSPADITVEALAGVLAERAGIDLLLLGTGAALVPPGEAVRWALAEGGIRVEAMATGAAARTYNVMLGERRRIAAALLAVD